MSSVGISTTLANYWLGTLRNIPFTVPITCAQLHIGVPGANGTSNPSAVTARKAFVLDVPASGGTGLTGTPSSWSITAGETISHLSFWSGFDGDGSAIFLFSAVVSSPRVVANGDVLSLSSSDLDFTGLAS